MSVVEEAFARIHTHTHAPRAVSFGSDYLREDAQSKDNKGRSKTDLRMSFANSHSQARSQLHLSPCCTSPLLTSSRVCQDRTHTYDATHTTTHCLCHFHSHCHTRARTAHTPRTHSYSLTHSHVVNKNVILQLIMQHLEHEGLKQSRKQLESACKIKCTVQYNADV